jgi:hypothetical protein
VPRGRGSAGPHVARDSARNSRAKQLTGGNREAAILVYRMESNEPGMMMPEFRPEGGA